MRTLLNALFLVVLVGAAAPATVAAQPVACGMDDAGPLADWCRDVGTSAGFPQGTGALGFRDLIVGAGSAAYALNMYDGSLVSTATTGGTIAAPPMAFYCNATCSGRGGPCPGTGTTPRRDVLLSDTGGHVSLFSTGGGPGATTGQADCGWTTLAVRGSDGSVTGNQNGESASCLEPTSASSCQGDQVAAQPSFIPGATAMDTYVLVGTRYSVSAPTCGTTTDNQAFAMRLSDGARMGETNAARDLDWAAATTLISNDDGSRFFAGFSAANDSNCQLASLRLDSTSGALEQDWCMSGLGRVETPPVFVRGSSNVLLVAAFHGGASPGADLIKVGMGEALCGAGVDHCALTSRALEPRTVMSTPAPVNDPLVPYGPGIAAVYDGLVQIATTDSGAGSITVACTFDPKTSMACPMATDCGRANTAPVYDFGSGVMFVGTSTGGIAGFNPTNCVGTSYARMNTVGTPVGQMVLDAAYTCCSSNSDCGNNFKCDTTNALCRPSCTSGAQCGMGEMCTSGLCTPAASAQPSTMLYAGDAEGRVTGFRVARLLGSGS